MVQNCEAEHRYLMRAKSQREGYQHRCDDVEAEGKVVMNALEILKQDHQRISDLFADAKTYTDMRRLFESIKSELEAHAHMEESIFYPEYQNKDILKDLVQDARTQHNLIKELLRDLESQDGPEFENSFQTLMAEVQLHFTAEENEIFPHVRSLVDGPDLGELGEELETDKIEYQLVHGS